MGLSGFRGGVNLAGPRVPATTLAGFYGTFDVVKAHPLLILLGLALGGYWATRHSEGKGLVSSSWGDQRYAQSRERSFHGTRRRRA